MDFGLGRFADRRLEKGGPPFMRPWWTGRVLISGGLQDDGRRRFGLHASFAIPR
jgi:hypothetical protein